MEEKHNEEAMSSKYPRKKLNFNVPLLSIRRTSGHTCEELSCTNTTSDDRVPFSWEKAAGKPKDSERSDIHEEDTPRPRLPPCLWRMPIIEATNDDDDDDPLHDHDDGDGDCEYGDGDVDDDVFSDAIDVFSLSEAIDIATKGEKVDELDGLKLKLAESCGNESPNYIIKRFLPDAAALAASSALNFSKNLNKKVPRSCNYPEPCGSNAVGQSFASPKGCGLESLFPWRMKHKLCGIKCPVRQCSVNVQSPQCRAKQKKHSSSDNKSFM